MSAATLKLTPLRYANVPPPMSHHDLQLEEELVDAFFNSSSGVVATLHQSCVKVFKYNPRRRKTLEPSFVATVPLPIGIGTPYQIIVDNDGYVAVLSSLPGREATILTCDLGHADQKFTPLEGDFGLTNSSTMLSSVDQSQTFVQTHSGKVSLLRDGAGGKPPLETVQLPEFCPWAELTSVLESVCLVSW
jgi:elongator complex protein 1